LKLVSEPLPGVKVLEPVVFTDERGTFVKPFHEHQLAAHGISMHVKEEFFTTSAKGVLRGMHFQVPPHAHQKMIYCTAGSVLDVLLDLRVNSSHYGRAVSIDLNAVNNYIVHVPKGIAHGFLSLEENSCLVYKTDAVHAPASDWGLAWNSFGYPWPITQAIISPRDSLHGSFRDFTSPFTGPC
jgi:dTDP-4-dehydrorhamnose 3,5-epimerase/CDP-3, 6-dideoxy-D-glycero-D-glycero-4-hexulose-5-epimerase